MTTNELRTLADSLKAMTYRAAQTSPYRLLDGWVQAELLALRLETLPTAELTTLAQLLKRPAHECRGRARCLHAIERMVWAAHESAYAC